MGKTRAKKNAKKLADAMEVSSGGATHLPGVHNHPLSSPFLSTSYIQARVRARCAGASAAFVAAATASISKGEKINGKVD